MNTFFMKRVDYKGNIFLDDTKQSPPLKYKMGLG